MEMKKICVEAKDENLYPVLEFAKEFLEEQGCSVKIQMLFEVCAWKNGLSTLRIMLIRIRQVRWKYR